MQGFLFRFKHGHRRRDRRGLQRFTSKKADRVSPDTQKNPLEAFIVEEIELAGGPPAAPMAAVRRKKLKRWLPALRVGAAWLGLEIMLVAASIFGRSLWPVDETRVLATSWEMWTAGTFFVPLLNGEPTLAAPLFSWIVHAGWAAFGVSEGWARIVPALGALASLLVTGRLARLLWPAEPEVARYAPLVLAGSVAFAFYTTLALPDMWLVFAVLLAMWALVSRWRRRDMRSFLLLGLGLGLGLFAGGALVLVHVLPMALAAPLWARGGPRIVWRHWYTDLAKALGIAAVLLGAWLLAAAQAAGMTYVVHWLSGSLGLLKLEELAAAHPWWWLFFSLPVVFLPWSLLPLLWMRLWHIRHAPLDGGLGFCLLWVLFALAALAALGLQQPQWLLPLLPAGALAVSWLWLNKDLFEVGAQNALAGMALPLVVLGAAMLVVPKLPRIEQLPAFLWEISPFAGLGVVALGVALAFLPQVEIRRRLRETALVNGVVVVLAVLVVGSLFDARLRVNEVAQWLAQAQAEHRPVAVVGEYHGEFQFPGRLREPLRVLDADHAERWAAWYPNGVLITVTDDWPRRATLHPLFEAPWRDRVLRIFEARAVAGLEH